MHALRQYVQGEMDRRGWKPVELAKRSGVSKQVLSNLLNDDRDELRMLPARDTIDGLAAAFSVDRDVLLGVVGEAMGIPVGRTVVVYDASRVPDDELLRELAHRLAAREAVQVPAPALLDELDARRRKPVPEVGAAAARRGALHRPADAQE
ncbi:helix-turn-helix transcriptional regulator [Cellulomonas sp. NPDC089187]|uniref:helix-turn-helix domain-containing protein n=1 Tax=Cellulomonas sp. NPDC089187 TaxID=3154970 RepID=UPI00342C74CB